MNLAENCAVHLFHFVHQIQLQILGYEARQNKEQTYFMILHKKFHQILSLSCYWKLNYRKKN